jgi:isopenicillin N synthase-like dioxygenase
MIIYSPPGPAAAIPLIDLADSFSSDIEKRKAVAWEIHKTCRDTGFFYAKNHGVPGAVTAGQLQLAKEFFGLSLDEKLKVDARLSSCTRGYEPLAAQTLDEGSPPDLKEGFLIGCDLDENHPYVRAGVPNTGPNQWPQNPPQFRERFDFYIEHMLRLGRHLMGCIALSLDLQEDFFAEALGDPMYVGRVLHYPPHPTTASFNQLGAGAHTDWGMLTILLQDDVGGLEVQNGGGDWISAPHIPDTFIINLGEMMPVLTNGLYHSAMHRVLNNASGRSRYSVPTFFDPNYFYEVKCVPTCLPASGEPDHGPTTVGQHIAEMYRKTFSLAA